MLDIGVFLSRLCRGGKWAARKLVEVRSNPGQHTQHPGAIKRHEPRRLRTRGTQVHDHVVFLLHTLQPRDAPAEHFRLVGQACLAGGQRRRRLGLRVRRVCACVVMELTQPTGISRASSAWSS